MISSGGRVDARITSPGISPVLGVLQDGECLLNAYNQGNVGKIVCLGVSSFPKQVKRTLQEINTAFGHVSLSKTGDILSPLSLEPIKSRVGR